MPLYLGIDGGGTKTSAAIASEDRVLGMFTSGGSNLVRASLEQVRESLHTAIREACRKAAVTPAQIDSACVGAAGASRPDIRARVHEIVSELVPAKLKIVGDMAVAHAAAFRESPGIVVIAGTGSIAYGRNPSGETARAGGWGRVTSDEGSGYWIGRRAVMAGLRAEDAGQQTSLMIRIMQSWNLATLEEVGYIANTSPVPDFSGLFPVVLSAASSGDEVAGEILVEAGTELARLAEVVMRRLSPKDQSVRVAMAGGVFAQSSVVRESFANVVQERRANAEVFLSTTEPVMGAVYLARKFAGKEVPAHE